MEAASAMSSIKYGESELENALQGAEKSRWNWPFCKKVSHIIGSTLTFAASTTTHFLVTSSKVVNTVTSVGMGATAFWIAHSLLPEKVVDRLGLDVIRVEMPLYFLMTQLYLNSNNQKEQQLFLNFLLGMSGIMLAILFRKFVTYRVEAQQNQESDALILKDRQFTLIFEGSLGQKITKSVLIILFGGGTIGLSFLTSEENRHAVQSCGAFYIGEGVASLIWPPCENWMEKFEKDYAEKFQQSINDISGPEIPNSLKAIRILRRMIHLMPLPIAALFIKPDPYKMAAVGLLHGVADASNRFSFCNTDLYKVNALQFRSFSRKQLYADRAWRVIYLGTSLGGLAYFDTLVFSAGNKVYNVAIGSFNAGLFAGFISAFTADRVFRTDTTSTVLTTFFYRTMHNTELFGMQPLYPFLYAIRSGINIASNGLNNETIFLASPFWFAYGYGFGQDSAQFASNRRGPEPTRIPQWLSLVQALFIADMLRGHVPQS